MAVGRGGPAGEVSTQSGRSTFCPRASNYCVWAFFITPPSLSLGQAHWAGMLVSLTWLLQPLVWGPLGRQVEGQPGAPRPDEGAQGSDVGNARKERNWVVITQALSSLRPIPMAWSLSSPHAHYCP